MQTMERERRTQDGWAMLFILLLAGIAVVGGTVYSFAVGALPLGIPLALASAVWLVLMFGFFTLQPNEAAVLILFGKYQGTEKSSGFKWANPLLTKVKVSLRARNLNMEPIKVNDARGNPIEIGAVVVWQVENTAQAVFDVDSYVHFVNVQSEAALRHMAMAYPYDDFEGDLRSLRGSPDEVSMDLQREVQDRVATAGVHIIEARLSHLAYAPEIAGAMLQRQQAEAIVAARSRIVDGAVGMVEMAIEKMEACDKIQLDPERRAAMVSNLMVVLCGHAEVTPIVNTGTGRH